MAVCVHLALSSGLDQNIKPRSGLHPLDLKRNLLSALGHGCVFPLLQAMGLCGLSGYRDQEVIFVAVPSMAVTSAPGFWLEA